MPVDFNQLHSGVTAAPSWLAARPNKGLVMGLHLMRPIEIPLQLDFVEERLQVLPANRSSPFLVHCSPGECGLPFLIGQEDSSS